MDVWLLQNWDICLSTVSIFSFNFCWSIQNSPHRYLLAHPSVDIRIILLFREQTQLQNVAQGRDKNDIPFSRKLAMGCCSGGIGSFIGTPSELALVRLSADGKLPPAERRNYSNVIDCIARISKEEGFTNLWRGATPTVLRATLLSSAQLGVTSEIKGHLSNSGWFGPNGSNFYGLPMMFCSTLCSSFVANTVANPFDVIKSRMQSMPVDANGNALYSSMSDCFVKSVRSEGFPFCGEDLRLRLSNLHPVSMFGRSSSILMIVVFIVSLTTPTTTSAPLISTSLDTIISLTLADKLTRAFTGKDAL